ncbi:hypothetical protein E8E14_009068 [Neopestalotiopsis sp. 37M]|nr:hypothetical protein E8E14_009068 [Neopestalotiopsis sp. 37M]
MEHKFEDGESIEDIWTNAVKGFEQAAEVSMNESEMGLDEVKQKIRDAAASARKTKSTDVIEASFKCVLDLGNIASSGASIAFPPAGVCYQAVLFLTNTVSIYRESFTVRSLRETIGKLRPHLETIRDTLNIEKDGDRLPRRLRSTIIKTLSEFVQICSIYAKVQKDSTSIKGVAKNVAKALVRYDGNMSAHLANIEMFVEESRGLKSDDVWNNVATTRSDARKAEKRAKIMESLDVDGIISKPPWIAAHREYRARFKRGTGAWLQRRDDFRAWVNVEDANCKQPVLLLTAPGGHGKSHLVSDVVDFLESEHLCSHPSPPVSIAYFYFGIPITAGSSKAQTQQTLCLRDALSAVIWQYAESDAKFQMFAAEKVKQVGLSSVELWQRFIKTFQAQKVSEKKTLFLVLDGVDQCGHDPSGEAPADDLRHIIENLSTLTKPALQIRLLLSCKDGVFDGPGIQRKDMLATVAISDHNDTDIRLMIKAKMDDICGTLKSDHENPCWREDCEKAIASRIRGNFVELNGLFNTIKRGATQSEVIDMINKILDGSSYMEYQLKILEEGLSERQIDDLNEILSWTVYMFRWPTIDDIHHILRQKSGKRTNLPLDEVRNLYGPILQLRDNIVTSYDVMEYFAKLENRRLDVNAFDQLPGRDGEDPIDEEEEGALIPHSEILIVQELVKNMCGREIFDKFKFEDHFGRLQSEKLRGPSRRIQCDMLKAHFMIISGCFRSILVSDENVEHSQSLDDYIARYLFRHMKRMQLSQLEDAQQKVVFSNLARFLTEELAWLSDLFEVWESVPQRKVNNPTLDMLLMPSRRMIAKQWLCEDKWPVDDAFKMILAFYRKSGKLNHVDDGGKVTKELIQQAESIAAKELQVDQKRQLSSLHHYRAAETLRICDYVSAAIERCDKALQINKDEWRASWCLARIESIRDNFDKALEAIYSFRAFWMSPATRRDHPNLWESIINKLWSLHDKLPDKADSQASTCQALLKVFPDHPGIGRRMLQKGLLNEDIQGVKRFLVPMLRQQAEVEDFHKTVYQAFRLKRYSHLKDIYLEAREGTTQGSVTELHLRYYFGLALFYHPSEKKGVNEAVNEWGPILEYDRGNHRSIQAIIAKTKQYLVGNYILSAERLTRHFMVEKYIDKVRLWKRREDAARGHEIHYLSLLLARIHAVSGQTVLAQDCVREYIRAAVEMLSDSDPGNDRQASIMLAEALTRLNDDENARAAQTMNLNAGVDAYVCDGECGKGWRSSISTIWICRDCVDTGFDDDCYNELAATTEKWQVCSKDHHFLKYPKEMAKKAQKIKPGFVLFCGEERPLEGWLDGIRKKYLG